LQKGAKLLPDASWRHRWQLPPAGALFSAASGLSHDRLKTKTIKVRNRNALCMSNRAMNVLFLEVIVEVGRVGGAER
jgi:hypothetical protein